MERRASPHEERETKKFLEKLTDFQKLCFAINKNGNELIISKSEIQKLIKNIKQLDQINQLDEYGKSPLYLAIENNESPIRQKIIKLLLKAGADLDLLQSGKEGESHYEDTPRKLINNMKERLEDIIADTLYDILEDADNYNKNRSSYKILEGDFVVDSNESITPTTDKGYFNIEILQKKLSVLESEEEEKQQDSSLREGEQIVTSSSQNIGQDVFLKKLYNPLLEDTIFIKRYQYQDSETSDVLRFGINKNSLGIKSQLGTFQYLNQEEKSVSIQSAIESDALRSNIRKIKITEQEKAITESALAYLNMLEKGKCVLVDVFDRKNSDIHTCVFVKQGQNNILLDPSNPSFSIFLKQISDNLYVYTDKNKTIYTPVGGSANTGPKTSQARDCIDIAVKLAFAINHTKGELPLLNDKVDSAKLGLNHAIESITNCTKVSGLFSKEVEKYTLKVKQSSNVVESKKASTLLKFFEKVNSFFEETEKDPISKKDISKYNKLNLEYKDPIKNNIQALITKFYVEDSGLVSAESYSNFITDSHTELNNLLKGDMNLKLMGEELDAEFLYIENNYSC